MPTESVTESLQRLSQLSHQSDNHKGTIIFQQGIEQFGSQVLHLPPFCDGYFYLCMGVSFLLSKQQAIDLKLEEFDVIILKERIALETRIEESGPTLYGSVFREACSIGNMIGQKLAEDQPFTEADIARMTALQQSASQVNEDWMDGEERASAQAMHNLKFALLTELMAEK